MTNSTFKFTKEDIAAAVENGITPDTLAQQFADLLNEVVAENSKNAKKKEKIADMQFLLDTAIDFINKWYKTEDNAEMLDEFIEEINYPEEWIESIDEQIIPSLKDSINFYKSVTEVAKQLNNYKEKAAVSAKANYANPKAEAPLKINFKDPKIMTSTDKMTNDEIINNFLTAFGLK